SKCRKYNYVARRDLGKILFLTGTNRNEIDTHLAQPTVNHGVVDDLVGDPDASIGKMFAGLICHRHRPVDPPAESKRLRQSYSHVACSKSVTVVSHARDQIRLVSALQLVLDFFFQSKALAMIFGASGARRHRAHEMCGFILPQHTHPSN